MRLNKACFCNVVTDGAQCVTVNLVDLHLGLASLANRRAIGKDVKSLEEVHGVDRWVHRRGDLTAV